MGMCYEAGVKKRKQAPLISAPIPVAPEGSANAIREWNRALQLALPLCPIGSGRRRGGPNARGLAQAWQA